MKILILLTILFSFSSHAAIPTFEGLLRNGSNPDVTGDTVALSFILEHVSKPTIEGVEPDSVPLSPPSFIKAIFTMVEGEPIRLLQIQYAAEGMTNEQIIAVEKKDNLIQSLRQESYVEKALLYSFLVKYGLNKSDGFNQLLSKISPEYRTNAQLINPELRSLYGKHKNFLQNKSESEEDAVSPLRPNDPEEKEAVSELLKENFIRESGQVKIMRQRNRFFWEVEMENIKAHFTQENHQLRSMQVRSIDGLLSVNIGEFIMFDGVHQIPRVITFSLPSEDVYRLRFTAHQDFVSRGKSFAQRVDDYQKLLGSKPPKTITNTDRLFLF